MDRHFLKVLAKTRMLDLQSFEQVKVTTLLRFTQPTTYYGT